MLHIKGPVKIMNEPFKTFDDSEKTDFHIDNQSQSKPRNALNEDLKFEI